MIILIFSTMASGSLDLLVAVTASPFMQMWTRSIGTRSPTSLSSSPLPLPCQTTASRRWWQSKPNLWFEKKGRREQLVIELGKNITNMRTMSPTGSLPPFLFGPWLKKNSIKTMSVWVCLSTRIISTATRSPVAPGKWPLLHPGVNPSAGVDKQMWCGRQLTTGRPWRMSDFGGPSAWLGRHHLAHGRYVEMMALPPYPSVCCTFSGHRIHHITAMARTPGPVDCPPSLLLPIHYLVRNSSVLLLYNAKELEISISHILADKNKE